MNNNYYVNKEEEVRDTKATHPHVVILGAGASLAAVPDGDRRRAKLPLMNNLVEVVGLGPILERYKISVRPGENFEDVYSRIHQADPDSEVLSAIEKQIEKYFSGLVLPDRATIYDKLVLSLREKDLIATFNWDPFLYQACYRNRHVASLPHVVYLHGNVALGYCTKHRTKGSRVGKCSVCKTPMTPSRLLYPIKEKNYTADPFINSEWLGFKAFLKRAFVLTIFGYGAPSSDAAAIDIMKDAWGDVEDRVLEQTEIIDVKPEAQLRESWVPFIHTHHSDIVRNFDDSWLGKHPRRSIEAAFQQFLEGNFIEENPAPIGSTLNELQNWHCELVAFERA